MEKELDAYRVVSEVNGKMEIGNGRRDEKGYRMDRDEVRSDQRITNKYIIAYVLLFFNYLWIRPVACRFLNV